LPSFIKDKKHLIFMLQRIDNILLETPPMKFRMDSLYNFRNVQVLPNFRIHAFEPIIQKGNGPLRCVFMSRIVKEKGIDVIFRFVESLTCSGRAGLITVEFFGPIEIKDEKYFVENIEKLPSLKYKGVLSEGNIHKTLNDYDILLLPTRYPGEGFPGAILDAYIAGIPVIVSDWKDISSFVEHDVTGFVFDLNKELDFGELLLDLNNNRDKLNYFKVNAHNKSKEYSIDNSWKIIENCLDKLK
jgi:glycosyltransferase involved in cell wall biosynthesis